MKSGRIVTNPKIDSLLREGRLEDALAEPISEPVAEDPLRRWFAKDRSGEVGVRRDAVFGSLVLGEILYDYIRIDPTVVEGIDFARSDDLSNIFGLNDFAEKVLAKGADSLAGDLNQLHGYVAERIVAQHLNALGHCIEFPGSSSQEGFDLLVDGNEFQVKCTANVDLVREHCERFPGIPVYVNHELGEDVADMPNVIVDDGLSCEDVRAQTTATLHRADDIDDFDIPWIALAFAASFELREYLRGNNDVESAIVNILTDTGARSLGGGIGHVAGYGLGLVFGPAGALVGPTLGGIVGASVGRRWISRQARRLFTIDNERRLREAMDAFSDRAARVMPEKIDAWADKARTLGDSLRGGSSNRTAVATYVGTRIGDDIKYFQARQRDLEARVYRQLEDPIRACMSLLTLYRRAAVHPIKVQDEMRELLELTNRLAERRKHLRI